MAQVTLRTRWDYLRKITDKMRTAFTSLNTMLTELYADSVVTFPVGLHASKTVYNVFVAKRGYTITSISYVPDIAAGTALTATVVKASGTATPAATASRSHR